MKIEIGQTIYFGLTERIDQFAQKRYSDPKVHRCRRIFLKGEVLGTQENEMKLRLFGNNGFEKDGKEYVFNIGNIISNPSKDIEKELGKWVEYRNN